MIWKSYAQERALWKPANWLIHILDGAIIVLMLADLLPCGWALSISAAAGLLWELGWYALSKRAPADRASVVDLLFWWAGSALAALWVIWVR